MTHRGCLGVAVIRTKGKENDNMPFLSVIVFTVANLSACYSRVNGVFNLGLSVVWSQGAAVLLQNTILLETEDLNSTIHTIYIYMEGLFCRYRLVHTHTEFLYVKHTR